MAQSSSPLLEIRVACDEPLTVRGQETTVVMIPFTGVSDGPYFFGKTIGTGVDTQKIGTDGSFHLSARYMLEGKDCSGNACRIFIENQGNEQEGFVPRIVTDSPVLKAWESTELYSTIEGIPGGVMVRIFRKTEADTGR
ncbi:MAG: DUF3237 family protein [Clostridia bacterium]|nr:DUF3237 family protein [Clostridia bacterium]